jgi:hypothetical protein
LKSLLISLLLPVNLSAQVVLSEVLFDEPGSRIRLEWFEIYNIEDSSSDLSLYRFVVGAETTMTEPGPLVAPGSYAVCARKLTDQDGGDSFEGHWGDSSGYWGDSPIEAYTAFEMPFSLPNDSGHVELLDGSGSRLDIFVWVAGSLDGVSFEKDDVSSDISGWHQCTDSSESTPGRPNSSAPANVDGHFSLSVDPRAISLGRGQNFSVAWNLMSGTVGSIEVFNDAGKRVLTLVEKALGPSGALLWNGVDAKGHKLSPGIYVIRFTSESSNISKTVAVVIAP